MDTALIIFLILFVSTILFAPAITVLALKENESKRKKYENQ